MCAIFIGVMWLFRARGMARTETPGIIIDGDGRRIIDKERRGKRIHVRLGQVSEDEAQRRLAEELKRVDEQLQRTHARPRFANTRGRALSVRIAE